MEMSRRMRRGYRISMSFRFKGWTTWRRRTWKCWMTLQRTNQTQAARRTDLRPRRIPQHSSARGAKSSLRCSARVEKYRESRQCAAQRRDGAVCFVESEESRVSNETKSVRGGVGGAHLRSESDEVDGVDVEFVWCWELERVELRLEKGRRHEVLAGVRALGEERVRCGEENELDVYFLVWLGL
mmetsp:Transcript_1516/g.3181  ORF Transcript_1516/g.3181 Transcript_1516/m.3181 type:complete len:184 (+) Transcript_1516:521-1072(+)